MNMIKKLESISKHKTIKIIQAIATFFGLLISLSRLIHFAKNKEYLAIFLSLGFIAILVIVMVRILRKEKIGPPKGEIFAGVGLDNLNIENAWKRQNQVKKIIDKLFDESNRERLTIVTGASGSGKSVIVRLLMKKDMEEYGFQTSVISDYGDIQRKLYKVLDRNLGMRFGLDDFEIQMPKVGFKSDNNKHVIVFDQFENYLQECLSNDIDTRNYRINWFCNTCKSLIKANLKIILVIRKEFFIDILILKKFLENGYLPHIKDVLEIKGIKYKPSRGFVYSKLRDVTQNDELTNLIWTGILDNNNELLPVEAQIVGLMIEDSKRRKEINIDEYFGVEMIQGQETIEFRMTEDVQAQYERTLSKQILINKYFNSFIEDSPNKDISMEVLFALSSRSFLRKTIKSKEIALYIHRRKADVNNCLDYFLKFNLIIREDNGEYRWAHDYLAEKYHEYSGSVMSPTSRDNISFFCASTDTELLSQITPILIDGGKRGLRRGFNYLAMASLSLLIFGRFMAPVYGIDWSWFNILAPYEEKVWGSKFFDVFYFPVVLSHAAWSYYITIYYDRFLSFLNESGAQKMFSFSTVIVCFLCVLYSVFEPYAYLVSIGVGGLWVGIRTFCLSRRLSASETAETHFKGFGVKTMVNSVIVVSIGVGYYFLIENLSKGYAKLDVNTLKHYLTLDTGISLFIAVIMIYYVIFVKHHYSKTGTAILLGIYDRVKR